VKDGGFSQRWSLTGGDRMIHAAAAMAVLGLLWFYHWRMVQSDRRSAPESGLAGTIRRLYTLAFSAAGLTLASLGAIGVLRWLLFQIAPQGIIVGEAVLSWELARLAVGLAVWLAFWVRLSAGLRRPTRRNGPRCCARCTCMLRCLSPS